ncbi:MAG: hypothetical protein ABSH41_29565 [Syntrophobacteraceae bacterium]|jgi:hypothetical protein
MKRSLLLIVALSLLLAPALPAAALDTNLRFITVDPAGSTSTVVDAINDLRQMSGRYSYDPNPFLPSHGFYLGRLGGTAVTFDPPGSSTATTGRTTAFINNEGNISGSYFDTSGVQHSYFLSHIDGTFINPLDPPIVSVPGNHAGGYGLNDFQNIVGGYYLSDTNTTHSYFLRSPYGKKLNFTTFDPPGSINSVGTNINDLGEIVGFYQSEAEGTSVDIGYYLNHLGGDFSNIVPPGSINTVPGGINNFGVIVGVFEDSSHASHGFILEHGIYTTVDFPNSSLTEIEGISDLGDICGAYIDAITGEQHGFVALRGE